MDTVVGQIILKIKKSTNDLAEIALTFRMVLMSILCDMALTSLTLYQIMGTLGGQI